jgi:DNA-binding MarR family transcriptional regulator
MAKSSTSTAKLSWDEIGLLCEGMAFASRPLGVATLQVTAEYSLGPRGAWITVLISTGVTYPLEIANVFRVGRSLITAELTRLTEAGLITATDGADRRRTKLALTPAGEAVCKAVRKGLSKMVLTRLASYSRDEILLCTRMLRDLRADDPRGTE